MAEQVRPGVRRRQFMGRSIERRERLTDAQLDGRACLHCGAEDQGMRPVQPWSEQTGRLAECVGTDDCIERVSRRKRSR